MVKQEGDDDVKESVNGGDDGLNNLARANLFIYLYHHFESDGHYGFN